MNLTSSSRLIKSIKIRRKTFIIRPMYFLSARRIFLPLDCSRHLQKLTCVKRRSNELTIDKTTSRTCKTLFFSKTPILRLHLIHICVEQRSPLTDHSLDDEALFAQSQMVTALYSLYQKVRSYSRTLKILFGDHAWMFPT